MIMGVRAVKKSIIITDNNSQSLTRDNNEMFMAQDITPSYTEREIQDDKINSLHKNKNICEKIINDAKSTNSADIDLSNKALQCVPTSLLNVVRLKVSFIQYFCIFGSCCPCHTLNHHLGLPHPNIHTCGPV